MTKSKINSILQQGGRMTVIFLNDDLQELYETGYSRKYKKVPKTIVRDNFPTIVQYLKNAERIQDVWKRKSLNFERMVGIKNGYSVRVNITWRLEMKIEWTDKDCTIGIIGLTDLTHHYKG